MAVPAVVGVASLAGCTFPVALVPKSDLNCKIENRKSPKENRINNQFFFFNSMSTSSRLTSQITHLSICSYGSVGFHHSLPKETTILSRDDSAFHAYVTGIWSKEKSHIITNSPSFISSQSHES